MRHAIVPRREIGVRTVFNILGPLTNPAGARRQLTGVAVPGLGETLAQVLRPDGRRARRWSSTARTAWTRFPSSRADRGPRGARAASVRSYTIEPEQFGMQRWRARTRCAAGRSKPTSMLGQSVLDGKRGPAARRGAAERRRGAVRGGSGRVDRRRASRARRTSWTAAGRGAKVQEVADDVAADQGRARRRPRWPRRDPGRDPGAQAAGSRRTRWRCGRLRRSRRARAVPPRRAASPPRYVNLACA